MATLSPSCCCDCYLYRNCKINFSKNRGCQRRSLLCLGFSKGNGISFSRVSSSSDFESNRWILNATTDTRIVDSAVDRTASTIAASATVEIPVTCYQLVGVPDKAEKDEIVKSVMHLKNAEVEEGYTMDAVISRQDLLMDVRDKLLFEPEYAGNVKEKIPPKSSLRIPWAWLPGSLCLLQEVGEERMVLDIGRAALQHQDVKPYAHDVLLSMALAECAIAKIGFERSKVSLGFEALASAQRLLKSKTSLGKIALLSQIEESLEELAPACTLELLGLPHSPENAERRRGAIAALRELLRQGLDVESSCRVQDWPCFLSQALNRLTATEIVDLLPWDELALTRKNKKSLESQNQRVVIDFNCFYVVLLAHIALGFSNKQTELINEAKSICDCLVASESIDLKFEEAFCLFLLGQGTKDQAVEKLQQLGSNSNPAARSLVPRKEIKDVPGETPSLETWLKEFVLAVFSDTRDCSPTLVNFFGGDKIAVGSKKSKGAAQTTPTVCHQPLSHIAMKRMDSADPRPYVTSSQDFRSAVKQLVPTDLQNPLMLTRTGSGSNVNKQSVKLKRDLGAHNKRTLESWLEHGDVVGKISYVALLGCILFIVFKLSGMNARRMGVASKLTSNRTRTGTSSLAWTTDSSLDYNVRSVHISGSGIVGRVRNLLSMLKMQFGQSDAKKLQTSVLATIVSSSMATVSRKQMPVEDAEALVKNWQAIKAEALGPTHEVHRLSEILEESMLAQWQALADAAIAQSSYWRFVLLQLSILRADILSDGYGMEIAEIEALLEEAAELVDDSQLKNPNYYSTYKIHYVLKRQDDGSWRFCQGDIQSS